MLFKNPFFTQPTKGMNRHPFCIVVNPPSGCVISPCKNFDILYMARTNEQEAYIVCKCNETIVFTQSTVPLVYLLCPLIVFHQP